MPPLTRWFIRTGLLYFLAALAVGVLSVAPDVTKIPHHFTVLRPVYLHLFMVGWVTQMIFGVAFWMFPRASRDRPRGNESLMLVAYVTLNLGLVLRAGAEPFHALSSANSSGWVLALSAALQAVAGLCFVLNTWGRVREK